MACRNRGFRHGLFSQPCDAVVRGRHVAETGGAVQGGVHAFAAHVRPSAARLVSRR